MTAAFLTGRPISVPARRQPITGMCQPRKVVVSVALVIQTLSACSSNYFAPGYTVDRTFTVTTPGLFVLSSSASASFETIGCYTLTCGAYFEPPIHTAGVSFSEVTSILGVFYQIVTGSGTGTAPADTLATANATGSGSDSVYLDVGNYTLEQSFSESVSGTGASWGSEGITFGLAAVPEPAGYPIVLGGGLLLALLLRGKFWLKYEE